MTSCEQWHADTDANIVGTGFIVLHSVQFGKRPVDYLKTEQTQRYIAALTANLSKVKKITLKEIQLVIVKKGGNVAESGTWLHPKLAIDFARWLSPEFAVWCDEQIERILGINLSGDKTTADDRTGLRDAVNAMVSKKGLLYPDVYKMVHQRFNVEHIDELTLEQVGEATEYLHRLMLGAEKPVEVLSECDTRNLILAAQNMDWVYQWYKRHKPALQILNHRAVASIDDHFGVAWVYMRDFGRQHGMKLLDTEVMSDYPWGSDYEAQQRYKSITPLYCN